MLPPDAPPALARALQLHQAGQREAALVQYDAAVAAQPDLALGHYARGLLLHELGRSQEALDCLNEACRLAPEHSAWQADRGAVAVDAGDTETAITAFRLVTMADPSRSDVWGHLGDLLRQSGQWSEALKAYQAATRAAPGFAAAWRNLSFTAQHLGKVTLALETAERAAALAPQDDPTLATLAVAWRLNGRAAEAVALLNTLLARDPQSEPLHLELASALQDCNRRAEARTVLESLMARYPASIPARLALADVMRAEGDVAEAARHYREVPDTDAGHASAQWNLGNLCWQAGHHVDAAAHYAAALRMRPHDAALHSNLLYAQLYDFSLSPAALLAAHREYSLRHETPHQARWPVHANPRDPARRLKLAYVSADFRVHPVAHFLMPLLAQHDRSRFEITAYANQRESDAFTADIRANVDHWVPCAELDDEELAARILADGIDILIDLSGHTAGNRLPVFARKPAPVQITWLSYPGTTGLAAIDYRISDSIADPSGAEAGYSEKLIRLPGSLCCFQPAAYMPDTGELPALHNGHVTFASFNNYNKLTDDCLALWARILHALPDARLLLAAMPEGDARSEALRRLDRLGVRASRVSFLGKLPGPAFVRAMQQADIALDPLPLTGGTTTMECLWMGLPTLVLQGERFISRVGASFLTTAGLQECLVSSPDAYVERAIALASDLDALAELRGSLRTRLSASPLLNAAQFARGFEAALQVVWQRWCAGQPAAAINGTDVR